MMMLEDYCGCNVFINDALGNPLACTTVLEYNRVYRTITIPGNIRLPNPCEMVTVLIVAEGAVHEYQGRVRRSVNNPLATDLALSKGQVKESRQSKRFSVNAPAQVPSLVVDLVRFPLLHPLQVQIVNLSSSGALIQAQPGSFSDNAVLEMKLNMGGQETELCAQVVRTNEEDGKNVEYGCKFIALE